MAAPDLGDRCCASGPDCDRLGLVVKVCLYRSDDRHPRYTAGPVRHATFQEGRMLIIGEKDRVVEPLGRKRIRVLKEKHCHCFSAVDPKLDRMFHSGIVD